MICLFCGCEAEVIDHLFFECEFSFEVCRGVLQMLKLAHRREGPFELCWKWMLRVSKGKTQLARRRRAGFAAVIYALWLERNAHILQQCSNPPGAIVRRVLSYILLVV